MNLRRLSALLCSVVVLLPGPSSGDLMADQPGQVILAQSPLPGAGHERRPTRELNSIKDVADAFSACWKTPARHMARPGMEITVRFSLARDGEIMGEPLLVFETSDTPSDVRAAYRRSIVEAFRRCTPFPLSSSLGNAIAGRPHSFRFVDYHGQLRA